MMTVNEVSKLAGVSIRTLQYYDKIGLLHPTGYTDAGYRLYDDADLERLQHILLFRELEFPLKDIKMIVNSPDFDRSKALEQQIELLRLKKEHIENLMNFALGIKLLGVKHMDFKAFDRSKLDEYSRQAKELYGNTPEYKEMLCLIFRHHIGFLHSLRGNCRLIYGLDCTFACISCFYISHRFPPFSKNNREWGLIHSLSDNNKPAIVS